MRKKFFAWGIHQVMKWYEPLIEPRKRKLFSALSGTVVEIGPGTGPNLKYFPKDITWTGIEPNPFMRPYLERDAQNLGLRVNMVEGSAMEIPLPNESADFVVGTLVLCSVPDPVQVLAEVKRVLKPGGKYVFVEHVAADPGTLNEKIQQVAKPLWRCCADGCTPDRRSWEPIEAAGFDDLDYDRFNLSFPIVSPHIAGVAVK